MHIKVLTVKKIDAGQYVPYIAAGMLDANDTEFFNVKGIQVNDPVLGDGNAQTTGI